MRNVSYQNLILIDGGKGQLNSAIKALKDLKIKNIAIIGLAKRLEEIYLPNNSEPQSILKIVLLYYF